MCVCFRRRLCFSVHYQPFGNAHWCSYCLIRPGMNAIGVMPICSSPPGFVSYIVIGMGGCIFEIALSIVL